ncbi:MAG: DUF6783 domain-containing protein [Ruminococcus sp.]
MQIAGMLFQTRSKPCEENMT